MKCSNCSKPISYGKYCHHCYRKIKKSKKTLVYREGETMYGSTCERIKYNVSVPKNKL